MNGDICIDVIEKSTMGVAYCKLLFDEDQKAKDCNIIVVNQTFSSICGLEKVEIIGANLSDLFSKIKFNLKNDIAFYEDVVLNNKQIEYEEYSQALNRWYRVYINSPSKDFFVMVLVEITKEREQFEEISTFFSVNLDLLCITDMEGKFIKVNKSWEKVLGYSIEELEQGGFFDFIFFDDVVNTIEAVRGLKGKTDVNCFINRFRCKDGGVKYIEWSAQRHKDRIYAAARDVTETLNYEKRLKEEKERYELALNGSNDGFWDWDIGSNSMYLSPRWKMQLGYQMYEIANEFDMYVQLIYEEDRLYVMGQMNKYLNGEVKQFDIQFRMEHKNGSLLWIRARGAALRDEQGKAYRMAGSHTDITEEKHHELAIREKEENFRSFFETIDDFLLVCNMDGIINYTNHAASEKLGYSYDELYAMKIFELHPRDKQREALAIFHEMKEGRKVTCSLPLMTKSGVRIPAETKVYFGKWNGKPSIYGIIKDLSVKEATLDKFHKLFDNNPDLMAISDLTTMQFSDVNEAFCAKLGYEKSEIVGNTANDLNLFFDPQQNAKIMSELKKHKRVKNKEISIRTKSGSEMKGLISGEVIDNQLEKSFLTVMTDISDLKNVELQLKQKDKILTAVAESTKLLLENMNYLDILPQCFTQIGVAVQVDRVYLFRNHKSPSGEDLTSQLLEWNSEDSIPQINNPSLQNIPFDTIKDFMEPLKKETPLFGKTREFEKNVRELLEEQDIKSVLVMPLFIYNRFWGFIGFDECKYEREWLDVEFSILTAFRSSLERAIERQSLLETLEREKLNAENANAAKSQFLANMSHEIRTPINGVMGMLSLLNYTKMSEEQSSYVKEARNASEILLHLINDILDISKIEAGKLTIERTDFDIRSCVEETVSMFAARAEEKKLDLTLFVRPSVPLVVNGDPSRLRQILNNLISNAMKFTHRGGIVVEVEKVTGQKVSQNNQNKEIELLFRVKDSGIGMGKEILSDIFLPFEQGEKSTTRKYGGTGLGLAITKELVAMMGGDIQVSSEPGKGSEFMFTVVLGKAPDGKNNQYDSYTSLAEKRILVVDPNNLNRKVMVSYLKEANAYVEEAQSGEEAIRRLLQMQERNRSVDVVITDYLMEEMNGRELAGAIHAIPALSDLKIILTTSLTKKGDVASEDEEIHGFLTKPVRKGELLRTVSMVLGSTENSEEEKKGIISSQKTEAGLVYRPSILLVEDNIINQKVTVKMLQNEGYSCEVVNDGVEALEAFGEKYYDVILMDCQMPRMDGYEATKRIRELEMKHGQEHVLIVAMTAYAMEGDEEKCYSAGMDRYLSKPVVFDKLITMLHEIELEKGKK